MGGWMRLSLPTYLPTSRKGTSCVSREWGKGRPWLLARWMCRRALLGTSLRMSHWSGWVGGWVGGWEGGRRRGRLLNQWAWTISVSEWVGGRTYLDLKDAPPAVRLRLCGVGWVGGWSEKRRWVGGWVGGWSYLDPGREGAIKIQGRVHQGHAAEAPRFVDGEEEVDGDALHGGFSVGPVWVGGWVDEVGR